MHSDTLSQHTLVHYDRRPGQTAARTAQALAGAGTLLSRGPTWEASRLPLSAAASLGLISPGNALGRRMHSGSCTSDQGCQQGLFLEQVPVGDGWPELLPEAPHQAAAELPVPVQLQVQDGARVLPQAWPWPGVGRQSWRPSFLTSPSLCLCGFSLMMRTQVLICRAHP